MSAASLLKAGSEEGGQDWGLQERTEMRGNLLKLLNDSCGCNFEKIKPSDVKMPDSVGPETRSAIRNWFIDNKDVLDDLKV